MHVCKPDPIVMEIVSYITVNLLLFSSWYIVLFRSRNIITFADRLIGTFVLSFAQIIVTEMVLGVVFKQLFAGPLFYLNISISLGILTLLIIRRSVSLLDIVKEIKEQITWLLKTIKSDWILMSISVLFFISLCFIVFIGYLFPSYSWDSQFYHLPTIGFFLQSGAIENIPYNSLIYTFINVFPKNIDLFFLWNVIFLKSGTIVDLGQLPFTIAGMLAVYSIAVKFKIRDKYAVYCALLFFFAPVVILQSTTNYVDIAISALFLIAMNFLLCPRVLLSCSSPMLSCESRNGEDSSGGNIPLLLAGITSGILLGSKGSGPLFVFALSGMFLILELRRRYLLKREGNSAEAAFGRTIIMYSVYFLIPTVVLGIYWYINNWVYYNNPVYPFYVSLFGKTIFPGPLTEILHSGPEFLQEMPALFRPFHVWLEKAEYYSYASELSGSGPLWFILFLPALVLSFFSALLKRRYDFLLLAIVILFVFLVHPNNWNTRYVIFLFALGALSFADMMNTFEKRAKILQSLSLMIVMYTFVVIQSPSVTPEKIKQFISLPREERSISRMEPYILNKTQRNNYGLWEWINRNVSSGDTLAYNYTPNMVGPLWNSDLSNEIVFIRAGKFEEWLKKLEDNNVTYVVALGKPRTMEYFWLTRLASLRNDPKWTPVYNNFSLEYSDSDYVVMRFNK